MSKSVSLSTEVNSAITAYNAAVTAYNATLSTDDAVWDDLKTALAALNTEIVALNAISTAKHTDVLNAESALQAMTIEVDENQVILDGEGQSATIATETLDLTLGTLLEAQLNQLVVTELKIADGTEIGSVENMPTVNAQATIGVVVV